VTNAIYYLFIVFYSCAWYFLASIHLYPEIELCASTVQHVYPDIETHVRAFPFLPWWCCRQLSFAQAREKQQDKWWMKSLNNGKTLSNSYALSLEKGTLTSIVLCILKGRWMCEHCSMSVPSGEKPSCEVDAVPGRGRLSGGEPAAELLNPAIQALWNKSNFLLTLPKRHGAIRL